MLILKESIVKGLSSEDTSTQTTSINKADSYLQRHGGKLSQCDKTTVNVVHDGKAPDTTESFMKAVEEDARRRADENKKRKVKADKLKEKGNSCFKNQKYDEAIKFYSEALNEFRTNTALYTNRAQVYMYVNTNGN